MTRLPRLSEASAGPDPFPLFQKWFRAALRSGIKEPTAMALATSTPSGIPSVRMVLLKGHSPDGFLFFTNYLSRKGRELAANPRAALALYWPELDRQIRIVGRVKKTTPAESDHYFHSRPLGSRFAASISQQSQPVASRAVLEKQWAELHQQHPDGDPPRPKHWGGYCVRPDEIEFWQQGEHRLHDRIRYLRRRDGSWKVERLAP